MNQLNRILEVIRVSSNVSYIVDAQKQITFCNPAWDTFAIENEAPELANDGVIGTNLFQWIPPFLQTSYEAMFLEVEKTGQLRDLSYNCSSSTVFRTFQMLIYPIEPMNWFLVTNVKLIDRPHQMEDRSNLREYTDRNGLITVCSNCRCAQRADKPSQWTFVRHLLAKDVPNVSHGLCPTCNLYFWPRNGDGLS
jgi:hypothetical protein